MVAAALMMSGLAVLCVVTASIASWLVQRIEDSTEAAAESAEEPVRAELADLVAKIAALRRELAELKDPGSADRPDRPSFDPSSGDPCSGSEYQQKGR
jgi:hypothetical protein